LAERGFEPLAFRYLCFSAHYRSKLNFTWDALENAQNGLWSLRRLVQKSLGTPAAQGAGGLYSDFSERFLQALNDDLNVPKAMAVLWEATKSDLGGKLADLANDFDQVLALDLASGKAKEDEEALDASRLPPDILGILEERKAARQAKDWEKSDRLREELRRRGYAVKDTKDGYEVTRM